MEDKPCHNGITVESPIDNLEDVQREAYLSPYTADDATEATQPLEGESESKPLEIIIKENEVEAITDSGSKFTLKSPNCEV